MNLDGAFALLKRHSYHEAQAYLKELHSEQGEFECAECGETAQKAAVTVHRGRAPDLKFCDQFCHDDWSFDRAFEQLDREIEEARR